MHAANLEIDLLRTFVAAADTGSFTAAGDLVARTQSAVSIQIKRLEEALDTRVFERTSRSLALTQSGATLLAYARRMLELNDESVRAVTAPPVAGEMRVGISEYFQPREVTAMLARFARLYPQVHLEVRIDLSRSLKKMLAQDELDLVIGRVEAQERAAPFWREPLQWTCAADADFDPRQPLPLVVLPVGCVLREQALNLLNKKKRAWRIALTTSGMNGLLPALEAGLGVSIVPASLLTEAMRPLGREDGLPDPGEQALAFYERRGAPRELVHAFSGVVRERAAVLGAARR
ncbi:MAG TPA: LysR substrate-binding domain-containing protein [Burkholderiales bacterium]|jgi:DNA-binding transcriptional LysR family regulator|nr:LysR substrate-binding domain-containing protein [Burkholderiales bacterium]